MIRFFFTAYLPWIYRAHFDQLKTIYWLRERCIWDIFCSLNIINAVIVVVCCRRRCRFRFRLMPKFDISIHLHYTSHTIYIHTTTWNTLKINERKKEKKRKIIVTIIIIDKPRTQWVNYFMSVDVIVCGFH